MCRILGFIFRALEVVTDEVPECITDEGIEVKQVDDVLELVPRLGLCLQEVHTCNNVFLSKIKVNMVRDKFKIETQARPGSTSYLDVLKFDLGRKVRISVVVVSWRFCVVDVELLVFLSLVLILRRLVLFGVISDRDLLL